MTETVSRSLAPLSGVLDTCVLFPSLTRDTLLTLATFDLYAPMWSQDILGELERNLMDNLSSPPNVKRLLGEMTREFPDALIVGYAELIPQMTCHPKDAHVLAAAVRADASVLVTSNLSDLPKESVAPHGVTVLSPDSFSLELLRVTPERVIQAVAAQAARYRKPPLSALELLEKLKHPQRFPEFAIEACRWMAQHGW